MMSSRRSTHICLATLFLLFHLVGAVLGQVNVVTNRYDTHRTSTNLAETILNPSNTTYGSFGKLAFKTLDGVCWTQPLLVSNINVAGKARNVLFVATSAMDVYAFDADDFNTVAPLWHVAITNLPKADTIGVMGTPVIDPVSGTLYAVTKTLEGPSNLDSSYVYRIWALNIYTGTILNPGGQMITGSVPGTGDNSSQGNVVFDGYLQYQRAALLLSNGYLYIAFGSRGGDVRPYHGWLFSYNAQTLAQAGVFCVNPNSGMGGIWGSGCGPSTDDNGNIYCTTGNGARNDTATGFLGDSVLKFSADGSLTLLDHYTPYNVVHLNGYNLDIGVTGPVCVPGTQYLLTGCKQGKLYLLNQGSLGGLAQDDSAAIAAFDDEIHGSPVPYLGPNGLVLYCWGQNDYLKGFTISNGKIVSTPFAQSSFLAPQGDPGGMLSLSANANDPASALLWSNLQVIGDAGYNTPIPGLLRVFDPNSLKEIWNSYSNMGDDTGMYAKNVPPVVANGKVYMVSQNALAPCRLNVYGLLNSQPPQPPAGIKAVTRPGVNRLFWILNPNTTSYSIYRATSSKGPFNQIATSVTTNSYVDSTIKSRTNYWYYAVASNNAGTSLASDTASAPFTTATSSVSFSNSSFVSSTGMKLNGSANVAGSALNLTNGSSLARGSAYYSTAVVPDEFTSTFTFQFSGSHVSGLTFVVQCSQEGPTTKLNAIGANQAELGYGPDSVLGRAVYESAGIKFVNGGANNSSTGLLTTGRDPSQQGDSLANSGIDFSSGDVFQARIGYDGLALTCTIADLATNATVTHTYPLNIYSLTFSASAYIGFTGSADTGSEPSVLSWTFGQ